MSLKNPQELQQMIEALEQRVARLEKVEVRVADLEKYVRAVQKALAAKGIRAPTL